MLSLETEKRIARLLFQTAECERSVERSRQDICSNLNFDLYSAFRVLDSRTNGKLDVADLKKFLLSAGLSVPASSLYLLIKQYDSNFDDKLSLEEFQSLVLSSEDLDLRREVLNRNIPSVSTFIKNALARHIELECSYQSQLETLKQSLSSRHDFSQMDCFRAVDVDHLSFINGYELRDFLRRNGYSISVHDLDAIIRRIDIDADGQLSYDEFSSWIVSTNPKSPKKKQKLPLRRNSTKSSPSKSPKSPTRSYSKSILSSPVKSPSKSPKKSSQAVRSKIFESVPAEDMQTIVQYLEELVNINNDLEREKIELVRNFDFNVLDFFRIFDVEDRSTVVSPDVEGLLNDLRIPFHIDEVYLLVRHYSSYRDNILRVSDFERMVMPRDKHFSMLLRSRFGRSVPAYDRLRVFGLDTLDQIIRVLKLLLISENAFERLRKELGRKKWINLYNVFKEIDQDQDGQISIAEFQDIMRKFKVRPSVDELEGLVEHFDRNFDRRVSYSEFIEELTPKLYN